MILSFITNDPVMANYAQSAGIERIMIDLETYGKQARQSGKNLFFSNHKLIDIPAIKKICKKNALFVRINPINSNSRKEVDTVIKMGADIVMLPYFHSMDEVKEFLKLTNGLVLNSLLVETKEAAQLLPQLVDFKDVHEVHIGFNDLSISFGYQHIFEPILNGTLEEYANIINPQKIPWGFGGLAKLTETTLPVPPELILYEQLRLKASRGWLGRTFRALDKSNLELSLYKEVSLIRNFLQRYTHAPKEFFSQQHAILSEQIRSIINEEKSENLPRTKV